MRKRDGMMLAFGIMALFFELLPRGVQMRIPIPNGEVVDFSTCYFDILPFGMGHVGPFLTAILTLVLLVLLFVAILRDRDSLLHRAAWVSAAACACSVLPLVTGSYTITAALISVSLIGEAVFLFRLRHQSE